MTVPLGHLARVGLREACTNEALDFTPWLAGRDGLSLVGDTIAVSLTLEARERRIGPFRADLVCRDLSNDSLVLFENQLARSDHAHLGQALTYAANLKAVTVVWIAERHTEEHRAACDWLNRVTGPEVRFFCLELEFRRIGDSLAAPRFNVVVQPNDVIKTAADARPSVEASASKAWAIPYWEGVIEALAKRDYEPESRIIPRASYWLRIEGQPNAYVLDAALSGPGRVSAVLTLMGPRPSYRLGRMAPAIDAVQSLFDGSLVAEEKPGEIRPRIRISLSHADPSEVQDWPRQHAWLADALATMSRALVPTVPPEPDGPAESEPPEC